MSCTNLGKLVPDLTYPCSVSQAEMIRTKLNSRAKFQGRPQIPNVTEIHVRVSEINYVEIHMYTAPLTHTFQEICAKNTYKLKVETCYLVQHSAVK